MSSQLISTIVYMIFFLGVFYVIFYFPDKKIKIKHRELLKSLKENESIVTKSGIVGTVFKVNENDVIIESGPDKVKIQILKSCIDKILK